MSCFDEPSCESRHPILTHLNNLSSRCGITLQLHSLENERSAHNLSFHHFSYNMSCPKLHYSDSELDYNRFQCSDMIISSRAKTLRSYAIKERFSTRRTASMENDLDAMGVSIHSLTGLQELCAKSMARKSLQRRRRPRSGSFACDFEQSYDGKENLSLHERKPSYLLLHGRKIECIMKGSLYQELLKKGASESTAARRQALYDALQSTMG